MLGAIADDGCNGLLPPGFCQCRGFCPFGICALLSPRVLGPGSTPPRLSRKLRGDEGGGIDCRTRKCGWRKWSEQPGRPRERRTRPAFSRDIPGAHATFISSHNIASERFLALHPGNLAGAHSKFARVLTGAHLPRPNEGAGLIIVDHSRG